MSSVAVRRDREAAKAQTLLERLTALVPLLTVFIWFFLVYAWQAWAVATPWLFTDELEFAQIARSIAESGEPARRGVDYWNGSLYPFLTAPAWLVHDVDTGYQLAKYLGAAAMTAVVFPAYGLARQLVSPRFALFAAAGAASIPAFMYSGMLIEEPFAYTWSTLCLFLIVRALTERSRGWIAGAVAACLVAPLVRQELGLLPAVFLLAALAVAWSSERGRAWRRSWTTWDRVGAAGLTIGAAIVFSAAMGHRSLSWLVATRHYKERMLEYGVWAGGALTIGLGVLPVVAGLALLVGRRGMQREPRERILVAVFASSLLAFGFYTAVKAAYLSTVFATRVAERNLIYLAPLFFVATAVVLERRRISWLALGASVGAVAALLAYTQLQLEYPYFEAPGFAILAGANRVLEWSRETIETGLWVTLAVCAVLLAAVVALDRNRRALRFLLPGVAVLVLAWNVTGQITASAASRDNADRFLRNFPQPKTWLDDATHGKSAIYLGQQIKDATGIWLIEFWNRSLRHVWSLDGTAPGPGPVLTPDLSASDGSLVQPPPGEYVVADRGVELAGRPVATVGGWRVYRVHDRIQLADSSTGVDPNDGWMGAASAYNRYTTPGARTGSALVVVSRTAWGGTNVPGHVTIRVGPLVVGPDRQPALGRVTAVRRWTVNSKEERRFVIPAPPPPFRVEVTIDPTFVPAELDPRIGDRRQLGAQVGFGFVRDEHP